jgi:hypothetical protein
MLMERQIERDNIMRHKIEMLDPARFAAMLEV